MCNSQICHTCDRVLQPCDNGHGLNLPSSFKRTWAPKNPKRVAYFYVVPVHVHISVIHVIQFSNSHDMLNQQKQEWLKVCQTLFPVRGWGLGTRLSTCILGCALSAVLFSGKPIGSQLLTISFVTMTTYYSVT